jgi:replication initiation and membrane attachment protein DnaB
LVREKNKNMEVGQEALNKWQIDLMKRQKVIEKGETPIDVRDMRNGEWFWIHKRVLEKYAPLVGSIGVAVYNALCCFANSKTQEAFPSLERLAELAGCSKPAVIEYLEKLENCKLIEVERREGKVNLYKIMKVK